MPDDAKPQVVVTSSVAARRFSYQEGQIVDRAEFAAYVGRGWKNLSRPFATERRDGK